MATISLTVPSGATSGSFNASSSPKTTTFSYAVGWSSLPVGAYIYQFSADLSAFVGGCALCASSYVETQYSWPGFDFDSDAGGVTDASVTNASWNGTEYFSGTPGSGIIGGGYLSSSETFYTIGYSFDISSSATVYFEPPPSKTLFFGMVT